MKITKVEQYNSLCDLFEFVDSLGIKVSSNTWNILSEDHGNWEPCSNCGEPLVDCNGECDDGPNYHAEYDDEASFE
jgi:hypothetical protein